MGQVPDSLPVLVAQSHRVQQGKSPGLSARFEAAPEPHDQALGYSMSPSRAADQYRISILDQADRLVNCHNAQRTALPGSRSGFETRPRSVFGFDLFQFLRLGQVPVVLVKWVAT